MIIFVFALTLQQPRALAQCGYVPLDSGVAAHLQSGQVRVVAAVDEVALQGLVHVFEDRLVALAEDVAPAGLEQSAEACEKWENQNI